MNEDFDHRQLNAEKDPVELQNDKNYNLLTFLMQIITDKEQEICATFQLFAVAIKVLFCT